MFHGAPQELPVSRMHQATLAYRWNRFGRFAPIECQSRGAVQPSEMTHRLEQTNRLLLFSHVRRSRAMSDHQSALKQESCRAL
jgi:hypothetical protein